MASFENRLIIIPDNSTLQKVIALSLEANGEFVERNIDMAHSNTSFNRFGEAIKIHKGYALIAADYENKCFLFRLERNDWLFERAYNSTTTEVARSPGMAISDEFIAYGSNNTVNLFAR